jgi:hypothetical protein
VAARADGRRASAIIDRRTVGPALLVLALAALMGVVLPLVDSQTTYHDEIHDGDVAAIADGITLVPTPGWQLASGALVGRTRSAPASTATTQLVDGAVSLFVRAAPFSGTPSSLLTRVDRINARLHHARGRAAGRTGRYAVTTRQGVAGVGEDFVGVAREGSVVAFVFRSRRAAIGAHGRAGEGVEIVVSGPSGSMSRRRDDIVSMIRSLRAES